MNKYENLVDMFAVNIGEGVENSVIEQQSEYFNSGITDEQAGTLQARSISKDFIALYSLMDGFHIKWFANAAEGIGGTVHFLPAANVFQDWEDIMYFEADLEDNDDEIQYFKPFDLPTEESHCGFFITPTYVSDSVYYHTAGENGLHNLDLDFDGYMEMATEARGFFYWQLVILELQAGRVSGVTKDFKRNMAEIFNSTNPDFNFNWDDFVSKYESLRLSNKEK